MARKRKRAFEVVTAGWSWAELGERLQRANSLKYEEVFNGLRDVVEANELLAKVPLSMAMTDGWNIGGGEA